MLLIICLNNVTSISFHVLSENSASPKIWQICHQHNPFIQVVHYGSVGFQSNGLDGHGLDIIPLTIFCDSRAMGSALVSWTIGNLIKRFLQVTSLLLRRFPFLAQSSPETVRELRFTPVVGFWLTNYQSLVFRLHRLSQHSWNGLKMEQNENP